MGLQYVGGVEGGRAGATGTTSQSLSGTLAGGLASSPAAGDLVVITISAASASGFAPTTLAVSGWTNGTFRANTGVANYSYQQVSYKRMTSTPDTSITIPSSGNARNAQRWTVQVFRGVDSTTPLDVTTVYASGTASGRPNPGAVTPATAGAWIIWTGASAAATGVAFTAPSGFSTNWLGKTQSDTYDVTQGAGYYTGWTSGSYDPAAITAGGTTGSTDSWVAETLVLRPAPDPTPKTLSSTLGGAVSVAQTQSASLGGAVQAAQSKTASLGAAVRDARTATASLGGIVVTQQAASATLGAVVAVNATKSASLTAAVQAAQTRTASLGAAIRQANTATSTLSGAVATSATRSAILGGAIRATQTASATLGAAVRQAQSATASLGAALRAGRSETASLGAAIRTGQIASATLDAMVEAAGARQVVASLSAAIAAAQATLGALIVTEFASAPDGNGPPLRTATSQRPADTGSTRQAASSGARTATENTTRPTATGGRRHTS